MLSLSVILRLDFEAVIFVFHFITLDYNIINRHDIAEILLKVALNTKNQIIL